MPHEFAGITFESQADLQNFVERFNHATHAELAAVREIVRLNKALQEITRLPDQYVHACDCANEAVAIAKRALAGGGA